MSTERSDHNPMDDERTPRGDTTAPLWDGTGYRSGALVVDEGTGDMGVMHGPTGEGYLIRQVGGTRVWTAPLHRLRIATDGERRAVGLSPRSTTSP